MKSGLFRFLTMRVLATLLFALTACLTCSAQAGFGGVDESRTCRLRPLGPGRDDTDQVRIAFSTKQISSIE